MQSTSVNLLESLKSRQAPEAWSRFVRLYSPMLYQWARQIGLQHADALDLVQDVFTNLVQKLPEFDYDADRGFREWLWVVTRNKFLERARRKKLPIDSSQQPEEIAIPPDLVVEEAEFRNLLLNRLVPAMAEMFQPTTWQAFWRSVVDGRPAAEVAKELDISIDAVYKAKARVISRLHRQLSDLIAD